MTTTNGLAATPTETRSTPHAVAAHTATVTAAKATTLAAAVAATHSAVLASFGAERLKLGTLFSGQDTEDCDPRPDRILSDDQACSVGTGIESAH